MKNKVWLVLATTDQGKILTKVFLSNILAGQYLARVMRGKGVKGQVVTVIW